MRVAYIIPHLSTPSGWRTYSLGVINSLQNQVEPIIFVATSDYDAAKKLFSDYYIAKLPVIQNAAFTYKSSIPKLLTSLTVLAINNYPSVDLVHSLEGYPTGLFGGYLAQKQGIPHIITIPGTYGVIWHQYWIDRIIYSHVLKNASAICPISQGTTNELKKYFYSSLTDVPIHPVLIGNNSCTKITRDKVMARLIPSNPIIISVGAVKPRKGYHISLEVFAKLKMKIPTAKYQIIGSTDNQLYFNQLLELIHEYKLEKSVEFLGIVSEERLAQIYTEASVFILTPEQKGYQFEGFGLVYLEAGAYGLPVIGTDVGGVSDAILNGSTGFILPPNDIDGLVNALISMLTNSTLNMKMGLANREWSETLTWQRYADLQSKIYQQIKYKPNKISKNSE